MHIKIYWKDIHQNVNYSYLWVIGLVMTLYSLYPLQNYLLVKFMTQSGPARKTVHTR